MTGQRILMRWKSRSLAFGLVVALATVAMGTGAANASAGSLRPDSFAQQAKAAGLNPAQAGDLQARVDAYLRKSGGTQVAANEIRYANGTTLTLTLPGEKKVRSLTTAAASNCPYKYFCAYKANFFEGDRITAYYCNVWVSIPWISNGSWMNNQTPGARASLIRHDNSVLMTSIAYQHWYDFNWVPVYYIDPC